MKKKWYVIKNTAGCFGASGSVEKLAEGLTKKKAEKLLSELKKVKNFNEILWIDFEWVTK